MHLICPCRYLVPQKAALTESDWTELRNRLSGLYLPTRELRVIGLDTVPYSSDAIPETEKDFLLECGVKGHPNIQDLVALCR